MLFTLTVSMTLECSTLCFSHAGTWSSFVLEGATLHCQSGYGQRQKLNHFSNASEDVEKVCRVYVQ